MTTVTTRAAAPAGAGAAGTAPIGSIRWGTVAALGLLLSAADTLWMVTDEGAIGYLQRAQTPFSSWAKASLLLAPVFAAVCAVTLHLARRRAGDLVTWRRVLAATTAVGVAATALGLLLLAGNSAYDYRLQAREIATTRNLHYHGEAIAPVAGRNDATCDQVCASKRATLAAHAKSFGMAVPVLLVTNLVAAGWVVAMSGGSLTRRQGGAPAV